MSKKNIPEFIKNAAKQIEFISIDCESTVDADRAEAIIFNEFKAAVEADVKQHQPGDKALAQDLAATVTASEEMAAMLKRVGRELPKDHKLHKPLADMLKRFNIK